MTFYKICETHIELYVRLTPNASHNRLGKETEDGALRVYVTAVPEKGKANKALIELIAKALKIPKTSIDLIRGQTDSRKTLNLPLGTNVEKLSSLLD